MAHERGSAGRADEEPHLRPGPSIRGRAGLSQSDRSGAVSRRAALARVIRLSFRGRLCALRQGFRGCTAYGSRTRVASPGDGEELYR